MHEAPAPGFMGAVGGNHGQPFLKMEKPCKMVFPCCCRPELIVRTAENNSDPNDRSRRFGRIELPCQCLNPVLDVYWNPQSRMSMGQQPENPDAE